MAHISGDLADSKFKAFTLDTALPTATGWTTVADAQVGDLLLDEHGIPTVVTGTTGVTTYRTCQRIRFDDGVEVDAHSGNTWSAINSGRRTRARASVVDWRRSWHLAEHVRGPELKRRVFVGKARQSNWTVPLATALALPEADLPLPPYVLGAWIGDGCKDSATMTTCDPWMLDEFRRLGMLVSQRATRTKDRSVDFGFQPRGARSAAAHYGLGKVALRVARVLRDKHVPISYLRASQGQRLDLLRGLMDTDGFRVARGSVAIEQKDRRIAEGLVELVRSLGWRAFATRQSRPHPNRPGDTYTYWHVNFRPDVCPFALPRKAHVWMREAICDKRFTHRTVVSVAGLPRKRVRGIAVASANGRFLVGVGMVPA